jgi:NAD(P)-dependent dehydrogenase (short-subunit alcohol dehydrogenase family)
MSKAAENETGEDGVVTEAEVAAAVELLEKLVADRGQMVGLDAELAQRLLVAAGQVSRPEREAKKKLDRARRASRRDAKRAEHRSLLDTAGIRKLRENPIFETPRRRNLVAPESRELPAPDSPGQTEFTRTCYTCREQYKALHWFYDQLCQPCGDLNYAKRTPTADLRGRVAVVTGSRVKIGYQAAIMLLRAGCRVICTTRFPRDAARRYAAEPDFEEWGARLQIHGIDLRHVPSVEAFCDRLLDTLPRLDFIINNACQTVRRPPGFYAHLMDCERAIEQDLTDVERRLLGFAETPGPERSSAGAALSTAEAALSAPEMTQVPLLPDDFEAVAPLFPAGRLDADQQQVDLRTVNSWRLKLAEVPTVELLEVHLVNAVAPFVLNGRLKPLMCRVPSEDKHIVNVSAMEGQFYRAYKGDRHPHTNMAKAALNMMTRTAALDYIEHGIHMNSVDTGWVTDEDPAHHADIKREMHGFHPPLDIVDGAARIVDPIFDGLSTGQHVWGQFLKDYRVTDW